MLFEFHRQQNAKKPGTVHATYLLSGTKKEEPGQLTPIPRLEKDGEDEYMQGSPLSASSMMAPEESVSVFTTTVTLVREENLEAIKSNYETINSIHIYSLGPRPLKDIQLLTDTTRQIQVLTAADDPLESIATYGTIVNPLVKRRPSRRPPLAAIPKEASSIGTSKSAEPAKAAANTKPETKSHQLGAAKSFFGEGKVRTKGSANSDATSKESTSAPPAKLKKESSSIFKSFAKTPKMKQENTDSAAEDTSMKGMEDDDDEEEEYIPPVLVKKPKAKDAESAGDKKSRTEREAELKRMMEESDEEEDLIPALEPEKDETVLKEVNPDEEPGPVTTVIEGRRRGKRRVTKKKTIKDEEGYLVTKEEAVWESFSEDEPIAPAAKAKFPAAEAAKGKKAAGKAGQGNIMSFFGKKT
ncbi:DNA polymerase subunit Cdc27 [Calycina marina]|uniref:DNA polymerase delta subunit 3 n=1 Tax=Calycina marina TaxID=1763456 RepID=A0A9P8CE69_9HELO|nr:DNA polymerase subunit Cdc27 [Calycina marina]